jgi:hypothetical protein
LNFGSLLNQTHEPVQATTAAAYSLYISMYHLGFMRPKSRRTFAFSAFLESNTFASPRSLTKAPYRRREYPARLPFV